MKRVPTLQDHLLTLEEAAERSPLSVRQLTRAVHSGKLPSSWVGRVVRQSDLEQFLGTYMPQGACRVRSKPLQQP